MVQSIYVHFPFCESRCHYCDFYALAQSRVPIELQTQFEQALLQETTLTQPDRGHDRIETLFFGGGTPSLTRIEALEKWLNQLTKTQTLSSQIEWTMECNPSSLTLPYAKSLRKLGVNRISMGVQSFIPGELQILGRVHDTLAAQKAIESACLAEFENVSIDLMCGVPGQTLKSLEQSVSTALSFPLTHLSCYILTLPKHHALYSELPAEEETLTQWLWLDGYLKDNGFHHYEISNFSKPGFESRHNLNYWNHSDYLGLGPSAHSYRSCTKERYKNVSSLKKYIEVIQSEKLPREETEYLTPDQLLLESWMLALRLDTGVPKAWFQSKEHFEDLLFLESKGYFMAHSNDPNRYCLTPQGWLQTESILTRWSGYLTGHQLNPYYELNGDSLVRRPDTK